MVACSMLTVNRPLSKIIWEQVALFLPDKNIIEDDAAKVYAHHYTLAMRDGELSKMGGGTGKGRGHPFASLNIDSYLIYTLK